MTDDDQWHSQGDMGAWGDMSRRRSWKLAFFSGFWGRPPDPPGLCPWTSSFVHPRSKFLATPLTTTTTMMMVMIRGGPIRPANSLVLGLSCINSRHIIDIIVLCIVFVDCKWLINRKRKYGHCERLDTSNTGMPFKSNQIKFIKNKRTIRPLTLQ